jgi:type I restriction enzyme M protein
MPRGTLTSTQGGDDAIRKAFLDDDIIECVIDLPSQLFFNVQIPATLWFFNKDKSQWKNDRHNQVLVIDARRMGTPISRTQIEFSDAEIERLAKTFNDWTHGEYEDIDGYCKSVTRDEIAKNGESLAPGRYTGTEESTEEQTETFAIRMARLTEELSELFLESNRMESELKRTIKGLGYEL